MTVGNSPERWVSVPRHREVEVFREKTEEWCDFKYGGEITEMVMGAGGMTVEKKIIWCASRFIGGNCWANWEGEAADIIGDESKTEEE